MVRACDNSLRREVEVEESELPGEFEGSLDYIKSVSTFSSPSPPRKTKNKQTTKQNHKTKQQDLGIG